MRYMFLLFILLSGACVQAQGTFDYHRDFDRMTKESQDSKHPHYYPTLLKRYNSNDTTFTSAETLAFMVGFTRQPGYKPKEVSDTEDGIVALVGNEQYKQALDSANKLLATYPLNFTAAMEKSFTMMKLQQDSAAFYKQRFLKIVRAIRASGDGSREHPYFILGRGDGHLFISYILGGTVGTMSAGRDEYGNLFEMLEYIKKDKITANIYFITDQRGTKAIEAQQVNPAETKTLQPSFGIPAKQK